MRAYGLPRIIDIQNPDKADIRMYALKSCTGCFAEKSGEFRGIIKNKGVKARILKSSISMKKSKSYQENY